MSVTRLSGEEFSGGLVWLIEREGVVPPFKQPDSISAPIFLNQDDVATRAWWGRYQWNPPGQYKQGAFFVADSWRDPVAVQSANDIKNLFAPYANSYDGYRALYLAQDEQPEWGAAANYVGEHDEHFVLDGWSAEYPTETTARVWMTWRGHRHNAADAYPDRQAPDPAASPKPAWGALVRASRLWKIDQKTSGGHIFEQSRLDYFLDMAALAPVKHSASGRPIVLSSGGVGHLAALIHHHAESARAGQLWPLVVVHDIEGNEVELWGEDEAKELIEAVTVNENRAESAGSVVRGRMAAKRFIAIDPNGGLDDSATEEEKLTARETALAERDALIASIETDFEDALKLHDARAKGLPTDLPRARRRLMAILEADATAKIKYIYGAQTQNGMDIPPACRDMANAIEKVGVIKGLGVLHIERADDLDEAERQYDIFKARIENVKPYRVPEFRTTGHTTPFPTSKAKFKARTYKITVYQPPLPDSVVAASWGLTSFGGSVKKVRMTDNEIDYVLTLTGDEPVTFVCQAANICGRNRFSLTLEPPAENE